MWFAVFASLHFSAALDYISGPLQGVIAPPRPPEPKDRLRVCNAFAYFTPLDLYLRQMKLTEEGPIPYKGCKDFSVSLKVGDKLIVKADNLVAGSFSATAVPSEDMAMLLVLERSDTASTTLSFHSHVFSNLLNSQIAVLDGYRGPSKRTLHIRHNDDVAGNHSEKLPYNTVAAINPGHYQVAFGDDVESKSTKTLVALHGESYIIMRTGLDTEGGVSYPEEINIFPRSSLDDLQNKSLASRAQFCSIVLLGMVVLMF